MCTKTMALSKRESTEAEPKPLLDSNHTHPSKRRRIDAAADTINTFQTCRVPDIELTTSFYNPNELSDTLSHADHVKAMLDKELPRFKSYMPPGLQLPFEFHLVQSATELTTEELDECFNLIHTTSGEDYKASSIGWNPKQKKDEMRDEKMMYVLIRQSDMVRKDNKKDSPKNVASTEHTSAAQLDTLPGPKLNSIPGSEETPSETTESTFSRTRLTNDTQPDHPSNANPILGFISFMFTHDDPPHEDREVVYIYEVHLHPNLRGRGLGSGLVRFAEQVARRFDITKTMLTVFTSNEKARRVYERLGYTKDACSPKDRVMRRKTIKADYIVMSKEILREA